MKKDMAIHFSFMIALLVMISVYRDWIDLAFLPFWFGAIIGTLLPDIDYLLQVYVLKPNEGDSQKIASLISQRQILKTWDALASTRGERTGLLIHSAGFQVLFLIFSFLIITSGSLLGMGLVLAFMLHLIMDEVMDLIEMGNINSWFAGFPVNLDLEQRRWFLIGNIVVLLGLGFLF